MPHWSSLRGCLERYVSLRAAYEFLGIQDGNEATPDTLQTLAANGDERLDAWIAAASGPLRLAVNNLELTLDPETVIVGGFMPAGIVTRLVAALEPLLLSVSTAGARSVPRVQVGSAGKDTSALGAAALPIFSEFGPQFDVLLKRQA